MTADQLFQFRLDILAALEEIHERNVVARKDLLEASEAQPGFYADGPDHARDESALNTQLELHSRNLNLRNQLYAALKRIADGTFGLCVKCEEEISLRRLQARPAALFCVQCQTQQEQEVAARLHPSVGLRSPESLNLSLLTA